MSFLPQHQEFHTSQMNAIWLYVSNRVWIINQQSRMLVCYPMVQFWRRIGTCLFCSTVLKHYKYEFCNNIIDSFCLLAIN